MHAGLRRGLLTNMSETLVSMYRGLVITEGVMVNESSRASVCRLSAALMQISAIFSAIACPCSFQLAVYPSE